MSSIDIKLTKPTGIFIIIERLYARDGLAPSIGELGPSLTQIHRTVIQLRKKQDMYMDGAKLAPSDISLWQRIKYLTGTVVTTKDTDELVYTPEFMGSLLAATPLANVDYKNIPRVLTTEGIYSLPKAMAFGRDPITHHSFFPVRVNYLLSLFILVLRYRFAFGFQRRLHDA